jgi:hypothetical protein
MEPGASREQSCDTGALVHPVAPSSTKPYRCVENVSANDSHAAQLRYRERYFRYPARNIGAIYMRWALAHP